MTSLKTSIKTITYLSDTGCLEIQGASLITYSPIFRWPSLQQSSGSGYWAQIILSGICQTVLRRRLLVRLVFRRTMK
ncbi:hypothetical protein A6V22_26110 [Escherichia coli]|nr:hypothetical protein [Escherichia coli]PCD46972.1 hypothetical protein A6V22_26110 [Escherichia coli]